MTPFTLLIFIGKKFPLQIGQYIFFWIGPKPKENLSGKIYYLSWARSTFLYLIAIISSFVIGIYFLNKNGLNMDNHPIIFAILFFAIPIFIIAGVVKLIEFLVKAYIYKDKIITLRDIIYIPLFDEKLEVYRPVEAEHIKVNIYKILSTNSSLDDEIWQFSYGDYVRCEECIFSSGQSHLIAVEKTDIKE